MVDAEMDIRIIKVCSLGLDRSHLLKSVRELVPYFGKIHSKFGFNVCGEGGEYESFVLDSPIYKNSFI